VTRGRNDIELKEHAGSGEGSGRSVGRGMWHGWDVIPGTPCAV